MPIDKATIGNVEIVALSDGYIRFSPADFFPSISAEAWEPYRDAMTSDGKLQMNMGCYLLRSSGKTVLVDTGLGVDSSRFDDAQSGLLMQDFDAKGISPGDVDIVMMTHLHSDHMGWNLTRDGDDIRPSFPNARYYVSKADWDVFTSEDDPNVNKHVVPLDAMGKLELFEGEIEFTSELTTFPTPGHTPGHTSLLISSGGEKGVIAGDASHVASQAHETDWSPRADRDPVTSTRSRHKMMDSVEHDNGLLIAGHYPAPGIGKLVRLQGRRFWQAL